AFGEKAQQLLARLILRHDAVENIRPVETRKKALGIFQLEPLDDFFPGALVRSGGQSDAPYGREKLRQLPQLQVFGAEIMPPLRYAMRFINGEKADLQALQESQHTRLDQALRRQVEHLDFITA